MHADGGTLGTVITVVISVVAVVGLIALAGIVVVMWRYRLPPRALVAMIGALVYLVSPIDVLPEAILGPFGLIDDAGVVGATVLFVYKLIQARKMLQAAGVLGRDGTSRTTGTMGTTGTTPRGRSRPGGGPGIL